ncbi:MAG: hypothetical protein WAJ87_14855 [Bryobacteraceae bacterium]
MRTTLSLEDDAMEAIAAYARGQSISLGKAASELIRRGISYQLGTRRINGLPVFEVPDHFPKITSAEVRQLLDEE